MKLLKKIANAVKRPLKHITTKGQDVIAETAAVSVDAALERIAATLPEIGDLLAGEEVTLEIKLRLRQKGES